jgi:hypothetical protein
MTWSTPPCRAEGTSGLTGEPACSAGLRLSRSHVPGLTRAEDLLSGPGHVSPENEVIAFLASLRAALAGFAAPSS